MELRPYLFSTDRQDTGLNPIENAALFALTKGPEEELKCIYKDLKGMSDAEKGEGGIPLYPPDITIQRLWRDDRQRYDALKKAMHDNPKCKNMDVFTESLYTSLHATTQHDYERKVSVSYKDALDGVGSEKRVLDKETFGRFNVPTFEEESAAHSVNIVVS